VRSPLEEMPASARRAERRSAILRSTAAQVGSALSADGRRPATHSRKNIPKGAHWLSLRPHENRSAHLRPDALVLRGHRRRRAVHLHAAHLNRVDRIVEEVEPRLARPCVTEQRAVHPDGDCTSRWSPRARALRSHRADRRLRQRSRGVDVDHHPRNAPQELRQSLHASTRDLLFGEERTAFRLQSTLLKSTQRRRQRWSRMRRIHRGRGLRGLCARQT
jgi:hypothetical protein